MKPEPQDSENSRRKTLLTTKALSKRYAVTVLDRCNFELHCGEIHALVGANGAGKSTISKIIAGLVPATTGSMTLDGKPYLPSNKQSAELAGVQIVQQELNLIPTLSVAENILLTRLPNRCRVIQRRELHHHARQALDRFGLEEVSTHSLVGELGIGRQQMVEIAATLDRHCKLLILDEPTAALSAGETATLFGWLEQLREQGVGIVYISHRLEEVAQISDRISVLRDGQMVGTHITKNLSTDDMVDLMSGEVTGAKSVAGFLSHATPHTALQVQDISCGIVRQVTFSVRRGERLGIAGLVGSGRTELLRAIYGADTAESGHLVLRISTKPRRFRHPREAVAHGLAMISEDRKASGLLLDHSIRANVTLSSMWQRFSRRGMIRLAREKAESQSQCDSLQIRCQSIEQTVGTLSGGNQQKVSIAKWLVRDAEVFLFDEPTRGIDVAARRRIYQLFSALTKAGKALVIVSSDTDELLETCDRIAVMSAGRLVSTFVRPNWSHDEIMKAAFSGYIGRKSA